MKFQGPRAATGKTFLWLLVWIAGVTLYAGWVIREKLR